MAQLVVRNLPEELVKALKQRAAKHNRSAEQEHREILCAALRGPRRRHLHRHADPHLVGRDVDHLIVRSVGPEEDPHRPRELVVTRARCPDHPSQLGHDR